MTTAQDAVQTLIPTLDISERVARANEARSKVETGVKLRGAEKVARIPVKIIPTTELPKKPPARTWASASRVVPRPS